MKNRSYVRDVFRNIGARSILAALILCMLTDNISLNYSTVGKNTWFTLKTWKAAGTALPW